MKGAVTKMSIRRTTIQMLHKCVTAKRHRDDQYPINIFHGKNTSKIIQIRNLRQRLLDNKQPIIFPLHKDRYHASRCLARWCLTILDLMAKALSQTVQRKGFSPECVRRCCCRYILRVNDLSQTEHSKGFIPMHAL